MLKPLNASRFNRPQIFAPGPAPQLTWLRVDRLVVDESYQRQIGKKGAANVRNISEAFDWSKFAPVIVAPVEGGRFAIVDGQHRTTAAMACGIEEVPCQVVQADRAQQAAAFSAVNGNVTKILPVQLFWANVAAGEISATAVNEVCKAAQVTICRGGRAVNKMKPGQTQAIGTIIRCVKQYGDGITTSALRCITQTADGNAGYLRSTIIEAVAKVLNTHPMWCTNEAMLHHALNSWSWPDVWGDVTNDQSKVFPHTALDTIVNPLEKFLAKRFEQMARKKAA